MQTAIQNVFRKLEDKGSPLRTPSKAEAFCRDWYRRQAKPSKALGDLSKVAPNVVRQIVSALPEEDLANAAQTCRLLAEAARSDAVWRPRFEQQQQRDEFLCIPGASAESGWSHVPVSRCLVAWESNTDTIATSIRTALSSYQDHQATEPMQPAKRVRRGTFLERYREYHQVGQPFLSGFASEQVMWQLIHRYRWLTETLESGAFRARKSRQQCLLAQEELQDKMLAWLNEWNHALRQASHQAISYVNERFDEPDVLQAAYNGLVYNLRVLTKMGQLVSWVEWLHKHRILNMYHCYSQIEHDFARILVDSSATALGRICKSAASHSLIIVHE